MILKRKMGTTDYTEHTDKKRVMKFSEITQWADTKNHVTH